jgi:hypothetical protein
MLYIVMFKVYVLKKLVDLKQILIKIIQNLFN